MPEFVITTDRIDCYEKEAREIMHIIGCGGALITDESQVSDFLMGFQYPDEREQDQHAIDRLTDLIGHSLTGDEYIWSLAKTLHDSRNARIH